LGVHVALAIGKELPMTLNYSWLSRVVAPFCWASAIRALLLALHFGLAAAALGVADVNAATVSQTFEVDLEASASLDGNGDPFYIASSYIQGAAPDPSLGQLTKVVITNAFEMTRESGDGTSTLRLRYWTTGDSSNLFGQDVTIEPGILEYELTKTYEVTVEYAGFNTEWSFWKKAVGQAGILFYADVYSHQSLPRLKGTSTLTYHIERSSQEVPIPGTLGLLGLGLISLGFARRRF
jgi:hypothetical protein